MYRKYLFFSACMGLMLTTPIHCATAAEGARVIEEVVVTARRREESLQEVPVAVAALTGAELKARGATHMDDLEFNVPNLEFQRGGFRKSTPQVVQRGIAGSGFNVTEDTSIGFYFNEVIFLRPHGTNQSMYDLESVQVLNGPQGTLFGKNNMSGAMLFTYNKPQLEGFEAQIDGEFGNLGRVDAHGMINIPLSDTFAVRANIKTANSDGYTRVLNQDNRRMDDEEALAWRVSALLDTGQLLNHFIYSGVNNRYNGDSQTCIPVMQNGVLVVGQCAAQVGLDPKDSPRDLGGLTHPLYSVTKTWDVTNITEYHLSDNLLLKNIIAYRNFFTDDQNDFDGSAPFFAHSVQTEDGWQVSEELQLQGETGALTWVVGGFYIKEKSEEWSYQEIFRCCARQGGFAKNDHQALFAQGTYDLSDLLLDGLSFTAGARQNWDTKRFNAFNYVNRSFVPLDATFVSCNILNTVTNQPLGDSHETCQVPQKESWSDPTWNVSLEYQITDDILSYVTVRRGIRTGQLDRRVTKFPEDILNFAGPEQATDWEIGLKADWLLGSVPVRSNIAAFSTKYRDKQQSVSTTIAGQIITDIVNTGRDKIEGVEVLLNVNPTDRLTLSGWYSYTDHTIEVTGESIGGMVTLVEVNEKALEPKHRGGVTVNYIQPLGADNGELAFTVSANFRDKDPGGTDGTPAVPNAHLDQPSRQIYNARLDWRNVMGSNLDLGIWGRNLGNEVYGIAVDVFGRSAGRPFTPVISYYAPRTYGASVTYRFNQ